ncbi:CehA/McbA family metallohydrolase [Cellulomonas endometrii]|uniref:CehA/McbA family metallohydrolase n=1 Tax=Cellulomonas endometrii TaxID=3036301 RepID=UPI0024AD3AD4|nr:CehA/McbA family metallohydrolase [Cellulomonas endometrii]
MPTLTIDTGGPARVTVRTDDGSWHAPVDAVRDGTAAERPGVVDMDRDPLDASGVVPGYTGHFVSTGTAEVGVPRGPCAVRVERGPEHLPVERLVDVGDSGAWVRADPERWVDLAGRGWWSGDLHVHRPVSDAAALLRAEDLHVGAFVTRWTGAADGPGLPPGPPRAALTVDGDRHAVAPVTEDERGGGAWLLHGAEIGALPGTDDWWFPPGRDLVDPARRAGAWFDCEKLTWWETPVMMATGAPDSVGVLTNHYLPGGFMANEAWGRPRDRAAYPGAAGASRYQLELYYRYLGCGLRLPASAGSASGVLPAPPGYNRVYVQAPGPVTVPGFYDGLRAGRSVVTNGPVLTLAVGDAGPGGTVRRGRARVRATAASTRPGLAVEVLVDGRPAARASGAVLDTTLDLRGAGWVAARATTPDPHTVRLAHTSPVYVEGDPPDAGEHRAFFARWVDELVVATRSRPAPGGRAEARDALLDLYDRAARFYG